jgi:hypothetical protein
MIILLKAVVKKSCDYESDKNLKNELFSKIPIPSLDFPKYKCYNMTVSYIVLKLSFNLNRYFRQVTGTPPPKSYAAIQKTEQGLIKHSMRLYIYAHAVFYWSETEVKTVCT